MHDAAVSNVFNEPVISVLDVDDEEGDGQDDAERGDDDEGAEDGDVDTGILNPAIKNFCLVIATLFYLVHFLKPISWIVTYKKTFL
jgi:hypothetical protein